MQLLIVGTTSDGPNNTVFKPTDETQLLQVLGGNYTERFLVNPTASSVNLSFIPWQQPSNAVNSINNYLFSPNVSGTVFSFGSIGQCIVGNYDTVDLTYTPYFDQQDLIFAARKHSNVVQSMPYVARIGGTTANLSLSDWYWEARYPGSKYNKVIVICDGVSSITVTGLEPNYPTSKYIGDPEYIQSQMYSDYLLGICPISLSYISNIIPMTTGYFSGGTDGTISDTDIQNFFDIADIPSDVTHVLFLNPITDNFVETLYQYMQSSSSQPRLYFLPAPDYYQPTSQYLTDFANNLPDRHDLITLLVGTTEVELDGFIMTRYGAESAAIGFSSVGGSNITNISVDAQSFSPELSQSELDALKSNGLMSITRHIGTDISVYEGTTSAQTNSFVWNSKIVEIFSIAATYCQSFIGQYFQDGPQVEIANALSTQLSDIIFVEIDSIDVTILGDTMVVTINGLIYNEILLISFSIKNK